MEEIKPGKYVEVTYVLSVGEENEIMEVVPKERPLSFIFGSGMMLEAFEKNIEGLKAGDNFDFIVPQSEAFGEYDDDKIQDIDKSVFTIDGEFDAENVVVGKSFNMTNSEGDVYRGAVIEITDTTVVMDFNHPLAGEELHFIGDVITARTATEDELRPKSSCGGCGCGDSDCGDHSDGDCCGTNGKGCGSCH